MIESNTQDDVKEHSMAADEEFRTLAAEHTRLHQALEALEAKPFLSDEEQAEEQRIKKLKLHLKDQMNTVMHAKSAHLA